MVGVVSSIPTAGNFILLLKLFKPLCVQTCLKCQICVENENPNQMTKQNSLYWLAIHHHSVSFRSNTRLSELTLHFPLSLRYLRKLRGHIVLIRTRSLIYPWTKDILNVLSHTHFNLESRALDCNPFSLEGFFFRWIFLHSWK